jgi:hypothetical protein
VNQDFRDLLRVFNEEKVRYLVVGGYALIKHSEPRYTKDLDLWVSPDEENAKRVFQALIKYGRCLRCRRSISPEQAISSLWGLRLTE